MRSLNLNWIVEVTEHGECAGNGFGNETAMTKQKCCLSAVYSAPLLDRGMHNPCRVASLIKHQLLPAATAVSFFAYSSAVSDRLSKCHSSLGVLIEYLG
jgi:hypothetical protein